MNEQPDPVSPWDLLAGFKALIQNLTVQDSSPFEKLEELIETDLEDEVFAEEDMQRLDKAIHWNDCLTNEH